MFRRNLNSEDVVRRYYTKIIKLPSRKIMSLILLGLFLIFISISAVLGRTFDVIILVSVLLTLTVLFRSSKQTILFTSSISVLMGSVFELTKFPFVFSVPFATPFLFFSQIPKSKEVKALLISTIPSLVASFFEPKVIIWSLTYILIIDVIILLYFRFLDYKSKKVMGMPAMESFRPFIRSWLEGREVFLEEFLKGISTIVNVPVFILNLKTQKGEFNLILPKIHYGLYGKVGSSRFVYSMEHYLPNSLVFHGPGSHELDLVSHEDSDTLASYIAEQAKSDKEWETLKFSEIKVEQVNRFRIYSLFFDKVKLGFTTRPGVGIDDMPENLWNYMNEYNCVLIDCHNETKVDEFTKRELNDLKLFIMKKSNFIGRQLKLGYSERIVDGKIDGLCDNRVRVMVFDDDKYKLGVVYLYGNNADASLGSAVNRAVGDRLDYVVVVTPDDHSCTGISYGNLYEPVSNTATLVTEISEGINQAMKDMSVVLHVKFKKIVARKIRVLGRVISTMVNGLSVMGNIAIKTVWFPFITPLLALILILFFQSYIKFVI
ncbi:hypothetical protein HS7_16860 [Sulfolobales archaeon HS-7]|nr:hypothetical protein HS7_16860 [Sulfolobales archaeon HS-7]